MNGNLQVHCPILNQGSTDGSCCHDQRIGHTYTRKSKSQLYKGGIVCHSFSEGKNEEPGLEAFAERSSRGSPERAKMQKQKQAVYMEGRGEVWRP